MAKRNQRKTERLSREQQLELTIKRMEANPQSAYEWLSIGYAKNHLEEMREELRKEKAESETIRLREAELDANTPRELLRRAYSQDSEENE